MKNNLLVFGAGNLGEKVATLWKERFPGEEVFGVTNTTRKHSQLSSKEITPLCYGEKLPKVSNILFSIPPKDNYSELVEEAFKCWDESGNFLFISSTSVYLESNGGVVNENSKANPEHRLFSVEEMVIDKGGCVLRLAGLYDKHRGPHLYLKNKMKLSSSKDSLLNLIHTQDAAELSVKALESGSKGTRYLGCDGSPMTKSEFAKIVLGEQASGVDYSSQNSNSKMCNNEWTRKTLNWHPQWLDFKAWSQDILKKTLKQLFM
ncbi:hypothetical protein [Halobacteriovorax sp.]|uniref:hypothetical protein n=1 Tax=Halobacteriovorax sp. TaxID=2020862 RepID=UPI003AF2CA68